MDWFQQAEQLVFQVPYGPERAQLCCFMAIAQALRSIDNELQLLRQQQRP